MEDLCQVINSKSGDVIRLGKASLRSIVQADHNTSLAYDDAVDTMTRNLGMDSTAEGIDAFLNKRSPQW